MLTLIYMFIESCQTICNVVYGGVCKFFHFDRTLTWCSVMVQTVEDHVRSASRSLLHKNNIIAI